MKSESRSNEAWWKEHGGQAWLEEIERRHPVQPHYGQQEAFLVGLMTGLPPVRVLDFGCGFGRHLKNLRAIEHLELWGCDISEKMLQTAASYLGDPQLVAERLRIIAPRTPLPWPDDFFDVVYTSEVLIHVSSLDLELILAELMRVTRSLVVHLENRPTSPSRRENNAQNGCWLHDFAAAYRLHGAEPWTLPDLIANQCVYLVSKPGSTLAATAAAEAEARTSKGLVAQVAAERRQVRELEGAITRLERERDDARYGRWKLDTSEQLRVGRALADVPLVWKGVTKALGLAQAGKAALAARGIGATPTFGPEPAPLQPRHALSFGDVATTASIPDLTQFVREQPELVALCHPDWRGIHAATYGQARHVIDVPEIASRAHAERIARFLADCGTKRLVINGFPDGSDLLAHVIAEVEPSLTTYFVYHGTPAQHFHEHTIIEQLMKLMDDGVVYKLGFVKNGLSEYFRSRGYRAEYVMNVCRLPVRPPRAELGDDGRIHIGVFAPKVSHKNVDTQLMGALMVPGSVVHTCEAVDAAYLQREKARLVVHGFAPRTQFLELVGQMHATSYVSLAECYPMTVLESLLLGAVCVTSHTSAIFDDSPELTEALVVTQHDSPLAIARKLSDAIDRRMELVPRAQAYLEQLNQRAEARWKEFIDR